MAPVVEHITKIPNLTLGEGPHWDVETQSLYFVDMLGKTIHKYDPSTDQHNQAKLDKPSSVIIPVRGKQDQFLVSLEREISIITWDGKSEKVSKIEKLAEVDQGNKTRMNDGKCDPSGRLWIGTMGAWGDPDPLKIDRSAGSLFSFGDGKTATHLTKIGISNGLAWNMELKQMYYVDSFAGSVDVLDFDIEKGTASNRRAIFTLSKHNIDGLPDGMTIDVEGNLWLAVFDGHRVIKIDPRKPETLLQTVKFPAQQVTSVAWGGKNLDILYVTSGSFITDEKELLPPYHGGTYRVTGLGTKGLPAVDFVLKR